MQREIEMLGFLLEHPERPFAAVIGGAKLSSKLGVLKNIVPLVDVLLIGGGMVATAYASRGYGVGNSRVEEGLLDYVRELSDQAAKRGVRLLLPPDVVIAENIEGNGEVRTVPPDAIPESWVIADIGPATIAEYSRVLRTCRTVVWSGPMGVFENPAFAEGTRAIATVLADLDAVTVVGGGSTVEAVTRMGRGRPDVARLDRGRGHARVPLGRDPAGGGRAPGPVTATGWYIRSDREGKA